MQWNRLQFSSTSGSLGVPQWKNPYNSSYSSQGREQKEQSDRKFGNDFERKTFESSLDKREEKVGEQKCGIESNAESQELAQFSGRDRMAQTTRIGTGVWVKNKKESPEIVDVYDLTVEDVHCFIVNEGFVVRNSMDAIAYALTSLQPIKRRLENEKIIKNREMKAILAQFDFNKKKKFNR
jgi:hypothetical protein